MRGIPVRRWIVFALIGLPPAATLASARAATRPKTTPAPSTSLVQKHTSADTAAARRLLPALVDFGPGWTATAASATESTLTCPGFRPRLPGIVETGAATSDNFQASPSGPFVAASAWVYRSTSQAATVWAVTTTNGLLHCFVRSIENGSTGTVKLAVGATGRLVIPKLADRATSYRVVATARASGQSTKAYYDVIVVGLGREMVELTLAEFASPVAPSIELGLARAIVHRLQRAPATAR